MVQLYQTTAHHALMINCLAAKSDKQYEELKNILQHLSDNMNTFAHEMKTALQEINKRINGLEQKVADLQTQILSE